MNNYFTSTKLFQCFQDDGIRACRTARRQTGVPKELQIDKAAKLDWDTWSGIVTGGVLTVFFGKIMVQLQWWPPFMEWLENNGRLKGSDTSCTIPVPMQWKCKQFLVIPQEKNTRSPRSSMNTTITWAVLTLQTSYTPTTALNKQYTKTGCQYFSGFWMQSLSIATSLFGKQSHSSLTENSSKNLSGNW